MNLIRWAQKATRQVRKLDKQHAKQVVVAVGGLINMPACQNVKALG